MTFTKKSELLYMLLKLQDYIALISNLADLINCLICDEYWCEDRLLCKRDKWIMFLLWLKIEINNKH